MPRARTSSISASFGLCAGSARSDSCAARGGCGSTGGRARSASARWRRRRARTRRDRTGARWRPARRRAAAASTIVEVRGQERIAEQPGATPVAAASSRPSADPAHRQDAQPRPRPSACRPAMYCRMKAIAMAMPAAKPPPGRSWPRRNRKSASTTITGNSQLHDHARDQQVVDERVAGPAVRLGVVDRRSGCAAARASPMLSGAGRKRRSRAKTVKRDDAEHGDLAERVEAAEVDQDHVDDVGAAAFGIGALDESSCEIAVGQRPRHDRIGERAPCRRRRRPRWRRSRAAAQPDARTRVGTPAQTPRTASAASAGRAGAGPWSRSRRAAA